jgi:hypothetical protein
VRAVCREICTYGSEGGSLYWVPTLQKTKIINIREGEKLNFLGYTFQQFKQISPKYKLFHDRQGMDAIACFPQKTKSAEIANKLRDIFENSYNLSAYSLIARVNPVVRGWSQYFHLGQSYGVRNRLNSLLYNLT